MKPLRKHQMEIKQIKKRHSFEESFDLLKEIYSLPAVIASMPSLPRASQIKAELEAIQLATEALKTVLLNTSAQTKITLNQIPYFLMDIVGYKDIRYFNTEWNVTALENDLNILSQTNEYALIQVPEDPGGPQKRSIPKYAIFRLASIFERGTGKRPKCGWKHEEDQYVGDFYDFVWEITPLLDELGIKTVSDESIGRYNVDILKHYRHALREYDEIRYIFEQNHEKPPINSP